MGRCSGEARCSMSEALKTEFCGTVFRNPVLLASGTCGFGQEINEYFDLEQLGGICSKGLTLEPRKGNEGIRIHETPSGVMNSIGLENPGIRAYLKEDLPWIQTKNLVNLVNLGGHSIEDYEEGARLLNDAGIEFLELNISCPNVKNGGMNFGVKAEVAAEVVKRIRRIFTRKLIVKLSPNAENIIELAEACEAEGADGLSLTNTYLAMAIDIERRKPVFNNVYAGLSGPAIKPISLRMVHQVSHAVKIPVIGIGGIASSEDAIEYIMAGASLVEVGAASFADPMLAAKIVDGMEQWVKQHGLENISEIRGIV